MWRLKKKIELIYSFRALWKLFKIMLRACYFSLQNCHFVCFKQYSFLQGRYFLINWNLLLVSLSFSKSKILNLCFYFKYCLNGVTTIEKFLIGKIIFIFIIKWWAQRIKCWNKIREELKMYLSFYVNYQTYICLLFICPIVRTWVWMIRYIL